MDPILENWPYLLLLAAIGIIGLIVNIKICLKKERPPYKKKEYLLNISERRFFEAIAEKLPSQYVIYPQIVMSAILETTASGKDFWRFHNKINKKIIDFVVFEKRFLQPLLAIEYDGPTHHQRDRGESDAFKDEALEATGIKIIRVPHSENLDYEKWSNEINSKLKI